jgi:hypothetical protein
MDTTRKAVIMSCSLTRKNTLVIAGIESIKSLILCLLCGFLTLTCEIGRNSFLTTTIEGTVVTGVSTTTFPTFFAVTESAIGLLSTESFATIIFSLDDNGE